MPRYDYECLSCGHPFELRQSFHEAGAGTCPLCSGQARRKFHAVPVIYKGSGFYTTDYGRPKTPPSEHTEKEDKEAKDSKKETKDAKDSKKETKVTASKESSDSSTSKNWSEAKTNSEVAA